MLEEPASPQGLCHGVLMQIAYDGSDFHGFSIQNDVRTVTAELLRAVNKMDPAVSQLRGTSRTDAGVHAHCQYVAFNTTRTISAKGWAMGLNSHLPDDVAVQKVYLTDPNFHPRFNAEFKRYAYAIHLSEVRDPRLQNRSWRIHEPLDLNVLEEEARAMLGTHDFAAFRSQGDVRENTVRTLFKVQTSLENSVLTIRIEGNAFMYNMVRILVGTLVDVARGRLPKGSIKEALTHKERILAGITAPPQGLLLEHVELKFPQITSSWPLARSRS